MRVQLLIDIPDEILAERTGVNASVAMVKRAASTGIITEFLAAFRQRNGLRGQSSMADRYLTLLRERIVVSGVELK